MTYGYNPWSDYEDEEQALYGLAEQPMEYGAGPSMPMPPPAAYQPPPHAEMAPLNIDTGPDWSDALGAGTTLLAGLADLGFNHGRGTGQILAAGGEFAKARADQRLRGTQDALGYEEKRAQLDKSNRYNDYLYASLGERTRKAGVTEAQGDERIGVSKQNAATKAGANARANAQADPSQFIEWAATKGYDLSHLQGATMTQVRSAMGPLMKEWDLEHADEKAQATRGGTIAADVAAAPQTNAVAADKAAGIAEATEGSRLRVAEGGAAARERGQQLGKEQAAGGLAIPGLVETDPNVASRSKADAPTLRKVQDVGGSLSAARDALVEMQTLRKQYGTELPGNAKSRFDLAQVAINGALTELGRTGVLSNEERKYYMSMVPNLSLGWTDALRPGGKDIKAEQLAGALQEFSSLANGKLRAYGYGLGNGGSQSARPAMPAAGAAAGAPPPQLGPGQFDVPGNLGMGPGGRSNSSIPAFPQQPGGDTVLMQSNSGITGPVPRDKVQTAIAKGWKLVQ